MLSKLQKKALRFAHRVYKLNKGADELILAGKLNESKSLKQYSDDQLVRLYKQMEDERVSGSAAALFRAIAKELKNRKVKVEGKLNEAKSWLTKNVFDALHKELKRTEPRMYNNRYFKKAFSVYLHDLDSMDYNKLGRERFRHLDKAWDYIDKNTEALSLLSSELLLTTFIRPLS